MYTYSMQGFLHLYVCMHVPTLFISTVCTFQVEMLTSTIQQILCWNEENDTDKRKPTRGWQKKNYTKFRG